MGLVCLFPLDDATGTTGRELLGGAGILLGSLDFSVDAVPGPVSDPRILQGLAFDGANDKAVSYDFMSGDHPNSFSLAARIKPAAVSGDTTGVNYRVLSYQSGSTGHACIGIDNSLLAMFIRSGGAGTEYHGSTTLVVGTEYHIALVVDHIAGTVKAYLNGVEEISQNVAVDNVASTTPLGIGCGLANATPGLGTPSHFNRWFNGTIWEPQAYDHALSPGGVAVVGRCGIEAQRRRDRGQSGGDESHDPTDGEPCREDSAASDARLE